MISTRAVLEPHTYAILPRKGGRVIDKSCKDSKLSLQIYTYHQCGPKPLPNLRCISYQRKNPSLSHYGWTFHKCWTMIRHSMSSRTMIGHFISSQTMVEHSMSGQTMAGHFIGGQTMVGHIMGGRTMVVHTMDDLTMVDWTLVLHSSVDPLLRSHLKRPILVRACTSLRWYIPILSINYSILHQDFGYSWAHKSKILNSCLPSKNEPN